MATHGLSAAARAFLAETRFATLATLNPDGSIQQTVMWYLVRGDDIVMNTARGRQKDRNLRRDPRVSVCIEDGYRFVTVAGEVRLIDDPTRAQADIRALAERYHGPEQGGVMARDEFATQRRVTILLPLTHVLERLDGD